MDGGAWWAAVQGVVQSWTRLKQLACMNCRRKWQPTPVFLLENPRDRGAWWAAVYGVAQSWTGQKRLSSSSSGLTGITWGCFRDRGWKGRDGGRGGEGMGLVWSGSLCGCLTQPSTQEACADHPPRPSLCLPQQPPVTGMEPPGQTDSPPAPYPPPTTPHPQPYSASTGHPQPVHQVAQLSPLMLRWACRHPRADQPPAPHHHSPSILQPPSEEGGQLAHLK